jgi:hypothetical protein
MVSDLFGLSISTGMVCKLERQSAEALEAPYNELSGLTSMPTGPDCWAHC